MPFPIPLLSPGFISDSLSPPLSSAGEMRNGGWSQSLFLWLLPPLNLPLLQHRSFPGALVLQKQTAAPSVLSTWSQVQSTNLLQHGVPSPLFTGPDRTLLHHGLPRGSQPPLDSDLLYGGNLYWLQVDG